jgi:hypothetical protein
MVLQMHELSFQPPAVCGALAECCWQLGMICSCCSPLLLLSGVAAASWLAVLADPQCLQEHLLPVQQLQLRYSWGIPKRLLAPLYALLVQHCAALLPRPAAAGFAAVCCLVKTQGTRQSHQVAHQSLLLRPCCVKSCWKCVAADACLSEAADAG